MAKVKAENFDWQIDKKTNSERARHMLLNALYTDCEFSVGVTKNEKQVSCNIPEQAIVYQQ